jgi:hypothetical protein
MYISNFISFTTTFTRTSKDQGLNPTLGYIPLLGWDQVSHPYKIIPKIMVLSTIQSSGFYIRLENKIIRTECYKYSKNLSLLLTSLRIQFWFITVLGLGWSSSPGRVENVHFTISSRSYPMGTRGSFPRGKAAVAWSSNVDLFIHSPIWLHGIS